MSQGNPVNYTHFPQVRLSLSRRAEEGMVQNNQKTSWKYSLSYPAHVSRPLPAKSIPGQCSCPLTVHSFSSNAAVRKQQTWFTWPRKDSTIQKSLEKVRKRHRNPLKLLQYQPTFTNRTAYEWKSDSLCSVHGFFLTLSALDSNSEEREGQKDSEKDSERVLGKRGKNCSCFPMADRRRGSILIQFVDL